jgi:hypothetical protein
MLKITVEKALRKLCHDNMVSQHQKFNLWGLYPNTQSKATSQVFTLSHLCCLELMCIVPAQCCLYPHYP